MHNAYSIFYFWSVLKGRKFSSGVFQIKVDCKLALWKSGGGWGKKNFLITKKKNKKRK
jgi:hypothetical protein